MFVTTQAEEGGDVVSSDTTYFVGKRRSKTSLVLNKEEGRNSEGEKFMEQAEDPLRSVHSDYIVELPEIVRRDFSRDTRDRDLVLPLARFLLFIPSRLSLSGVSTLTIITFTHPSGEEGFVGEFRLAMPIHLFARRDRPIVSNARLRNPGLVSQPCSRSLTRDIS